jgi:hypothetical protein
MKYKWITCQQITNNICCFSCHLNVKCKRCLTFFLPETLLCQRGVLWIDCLCGSSWLMILFSFQSNIFKRREPLWVYYKWVINRLALSQTCSVGWKTAVHGSCFLLLCSINCCIQVASNLQLIDVIKSHHSLEQLSEYCNSCVYCFQSP